MLFRRACEGGEPAHAHRAVHNGVHVTAGPRGEPFSAVMKQSEKVETLKKTCKAQPLNDV